MDKNVVVILARPEHPENIGLVARGMKNTGFRRLRLTGIERLEEKSFVTAVHAADVLRRADFFESLEEATSDLDLIFAASSKPRKNFTFLSLEEAVDKIEVFAKETRIGLLFGNERTGLSSKELMHSNFKYIIPQAAMQPSYNLAFAVVLTLFSVFSRKAGPFPAKLEKPVCRAGQEECIRLILSRLKEVGFVHKTNKVHVAQTVTDLFGRLTMTDKDRRFLLAVFGKGAKTSRE